MLTVPESGLASPRISRLPRWSNSSDKPFASSVAVLISWSLHRPQAAAALLEEALCGVETNITVVVPLSERLDNSKVVAGKLSRRAGAG